MKVTNRYGLPEPLVRAVENDLYSKGDADYSVTELIDAPVMRALLRKHGDEIEQDVSDSIWALNGQVMHGILERADPSCRIEGFLHFIDSLAAIPERIIDMIHAGCRALLGMMGVRYGVSERRFFGEFDGIKVSGQADYYEPKKGGGWLLSDYKNCKVWSVLDGRVKEEWEAQLNILLLLADMDPGCPLQWDNTDLQIVALLRDWSKLAKLRSGQDYPPGEVIVLPVKKWPRERAVAYTKARISAHRLTDESCFMLPPCADEDRWVRPSRFAVIKDGRKSALRVLDSRAEAETWMAENKKGDRIVERPGEEVRCLHYCRVWSWCEHGKKVHAEVDSQTGLPVEMSF